MPEFYIVPPRLIVGSFDRANVVTSINNLRGDLTFTADLNTGITVKIAGNNIQYGAIPGFYVKRSGDTFLGNLDFTPSGSNYGLSLANVTSDPGTGRTGGLIFNTTEGQIKYYTVATGWTSISTAGGISYAQGDSRYLKLAADNDPMQGDLEMGTYFLRIGNKATQVSAGSAGQIYWNTDNYRLEVYNDNTLAWEPIGGGGITSLNGLTEPSQIFKVGTSGSLFNIASNSGIHTFNIPIAGIAATGLVSTLDQSFAGVKTFTNNTVVSSTTISSNPSNGSLVVYGGLGISGNVSIGQTLLFFNSNNSNYIGIKAGSSSGNTIYILPTSTPASGSSFLTSTIDGTLSWLPISSVNLASFATTAGLAYTAQNINLVDTVENSNFYITFSKNINGSGVALSAGSGLSFNPFTNTLTTANFVGNLTGIADTAKNVNVTLSGSANTAFYLSFHRVLSGSGVALSSDSAISYNPSALIMSVSGLAVTASTGGTTSTQGALVVTGNVGIGGSLYVAGAGNTGLILGSMPGGGYAAIWSQNSAPTSGNYLVATNGNAGLLNGLTAAHITIGAQQKLSVDTSSITIQPTTGSATTSAGALYVKGTAAFAQTVNIGGRLFLFSSANGTNSVGFLYSGTANTVYRLPDTTPVGTANSILQSTPGGILSWIPNLSVSSALATTSNNVDVVLGGNPNQTFSLVLTPSTSSASGAALSIDSEATYNPFTNLLSVGSLAANGVTIGSAQGTINTATGNLILNSASGTVQISGNLVVNGNTTTIGSTYTTLLDPIFVLGAGNGGTNPTFDDNKDRGIEFRYFSGSAKTGFFGFDDSTGYFTFIPDGLNNDEVFSGAAGTAQFATVIANLTGTATTAGIAITAKNIDLNSGNTNSNHYLVFSLSNSGSGVALSSNTTLLYNPSTEILQSSKIIASSGQSAFFYNTPSLSPNYDASLFVNGGLAVSYNIAVRNNILIGSSTPPLSSNFGLLGANFIRIRSNDDTSSDMGFEIYKSGNSQRPRLALTMNAGGTGLAGVAWGKTGVGSIYDITMSQVSSNRLTFSVVDSSNNLQSRLSFTDNSNITQFIFGYSGIGNSNRVDFTLENPLAGTDVSGNEWRFGARPGTGAGDPGTIKFFTADRLTSGTTQQSTTAILDLLENSVVVYKGLSSSSTQSGAFQVQGGVGITGNAFIGGTVNIQNTTQSVSSTSGALIVSGGVGIGQTLSLGGRLTFFNGANFASFVYPSGGISTVYTLPASAPSTGTSVLQSDNLGNLSWVAVSSSSSGLATTAQNIQIQNATVNTVHPVTFTPTSSASGSALSSNLTLGFNPSSFSLYTSGLFVTSISSTRVLFTGSGGQVSSAAGFTYNSSTDTLHLVGSNSTNPNLEIKKSTSGFIATEIGLRLSNTQTPSSIIHYYNAPWLEFLSKAGTNTRNNGRWRFNNYVIPSGSDLGNYLYFEYSVDNGSSLSWNPMIAAVGFSNPITSTNRDVFQVSADVTIGGPSWFGPKFASSTSSAQLVVYGGVGITGNAFIGGTTNIVVGSLGVTNPGIGLALYNNNSATASSTLLWSPSVDFYIDRYVQGNSFSKFQMQAFSTAANDNGLLLIVRDDVSSTASTVFQALPGGKLLLPTSTASTSITTGTLIVYGGAGITGAVNIGENASIRSGSELRLYRSANDKYSGFKFTGSIDSMYTLPEYPTGSGVANSVLQSSDTGILSWIPMSASSSGLANTAQNINVVLSGSANTAFFVPFTRVISGSGVALSSDSAISYNPSTYTMSVSGLAVTNTTSSTSTSTGALTIAGGVGIGGSLYVGGIGASISGVRILNGVINTGTWAATAITTAYGGFGAIPVVTKGDILVGSGNTWYNLPVSATSNDVLTVDSTQPFGVKWAPVPPASASSVAVKPTNDSGTRYLLFVNSSDGSGLALSADTTLTYEASTNLLSLGTGSLAANGVTVGSAQGTINTATGNLILNGASGIVQISGDLVVNGNTTTIGSTYTTLLDPIFVLGAGNGGTNPTFDDNKDRGIEFRYFSGTAKTGFFGFDDSTGYFTFIPDGLNNDEVFSGAAGTIQANLIGIASTSNYANQSGYAITSGLATTAQNINVVSNNTATGNHPLVFTPSSSTASGVAQSINTTFNFVPSTNTLNVSGLAITATTATGSTLTGALLVAGGAAVGQSLSVGGMLQFFNGVNFASFIYTGGGPSTVYTLPATAPTGAGVAASVLQSDNIGNLSWVPMASSSSGLATTAQNINVVSGFADITYYFPLIGATSGSGLALTSGFGLSYNPSATTLYTGSLSLNNNTSSTSANSGALIVSGGVGIGGSLWVGGTGSSISGLSIDNGIVNLGTWAGSTITSRYGGTGYQSYSTGDILAGAGSTLYRLPVGTNNYVLTANSTLPGGMGWTYVPGAAVTSLAPNSPFPSQLWWNNEDGSLSIYYQDVDTTQWVEIVSGYSNYGTVNTGAIGSVAYYAATGDVVSPSSDLFISAGNGVSVNSTSDTITPSTGALVVKGGAGIAKSLSIGGRLQLFNNAAMTAFVASTTSVGSTVYVLPSSTPAGTANSILQSTPEGIMSWVPMTGGPGGSGTVNSGIANSAAFYAADGTAVSATTNLTFAGNSVTVIPTTSSTSTSTGALVVRGGLGLVGNAFIGGTVTIADNTNSISSDTGSLILSGGAGVALSLSIGGRLQFFNGANFASFAYTGGGPSTVYYLPITGPTGIGNSFLVSNSSGVMSWVPQPTTGSGNPGGSDTQIQFNDGGSFGGTSYFTFAKSTNLVSIGATLNAVENYASGLRLYNDQLTSLSGVLRRSSPSIELVGIANTGVITGGRYNRFGIYALGESNSYEATLRVMYSYDTGTAGFTTMFGINSFYGVGIGASDSGYLNYFRTPNTQTADKTYILPNDYPGTATSVLQSNTTGTLSWVPMTASGGGAGTVYTGVASRLAYYQASGAAVTDTYGMNYNVTGTASTFTIFGGASLGSTVFIIQALDANTVRVGIGTNAPQFALDVVGEISATNKSFVINHPTKAGMKLRYGSLEGPENGVYVRGQLIGSTIIETPDYWRGLVYDDSFTVHLTPVGNYQQLYVNNIQDYKVYVGTAGTELINCYYSIWAERKDVPKLIVEY